MTIQPTQSQVLNTSSFIVGDNLFDISECNSTERTYDCISEEDIPDLDCRIDMDTYNALPPCLQKILNDGYGGKYVGTYKRMLMIVYMRDVGIPIGNIVELFKYYLIGKRKGVFEWQHCLHEHQIEFIYLKSIQYGFPDCDKLKDNDICHYTGYCEHVKKYYDGKYVLKMYKWFKMLEYNQIYCGENERDFIGFELSQEYCDIANERTGDLLWHY